MKRFPRLSKAAFGVWVLAATLVASLLMSRHLLALPAPERLDGTLAGSMAALRGDSQRGRFMAVHVIYATCSCTQRIVTHLTSSERPAGLVEKVIVVGDASAWSDRLTAAGFEVVPATPKELKDRFHIESAPLLVVTGPDDSVRYAGGYSPQQAGVDLRDLEILRGVMSERLLDTLPVLGCAVSERLKDLINPVGMP